MEFAGTQRGVEISQGETVFAANGEKIGHIDKVLYDKATGRPEWIALQTLLGSRVAPFSGAERRADGVFLPYGASQIESAPPLYGDKISQELERRLAPHYALQYSETRSPTGLAEGKKSGSTGQGRGSSQGERRRATTQRGRRSGRSQRSQGLTRDELYEEAKRLGIEGRSKMNKAQLERAVGKSRGRTPSKARAGNANPFEVQTFLEAVGYPASKRELVNEAKERGAHARVRSTLDRLPEEHFDSPAAVSKAIGRLG
jgi:hypothetical protein